MTKKPEPVVAEVTLKRIPACNEQYYRYHKRAADLLRAVIKHAPDKGASGLLHESIIPKNNPLVAHPHLVLQEQHGQVWAILETLDPKFRAVLVLRDIHGLSCREIAPILRITHATTRWRLHRGRQVFREHWERRSGGDS